MNVLKWVTIALLVGSGMTGRAETIAHVTVENELDRHREVEMVEIPVPDLGIAIGHEVRVLDSTGNPIPCQVTYDGKLIFPVSIAAKSRKSFIIEAGMPRQFPVVACGRCYPERYDDLAWENDKSAYRAYGPALQARGEKAYGYDIMCKSVDYPVLEHRYALELDRPARAQIEEWRSRGNRERADSLFRAISYHVDHGNGMDCYSVGPTLGGGTAALLQEGEIIYPYCYEHAEILDNGPLRFTAGLTFRPMAIGGDKGVVETRVITLDQGCYLNKTTVNYLNLTREMPFVAGIVVHPQHRDGYAMNIESGYAAYADSTDRVNAGHGVVYVGVVFPEPVDSAYMKSFSAKESKERAGALGHVLVQSKYRPGESKTYYWGSGWSKNDVADFRAWNTILQRYTERLQSPLKVTIKK